RQSSFDKLLINYINNGKPVYGGSAGAIIFGKDVRSSSEFKKATKKEARGLNVLFGYSVIPHYNIKTQTRFNQPLIAIPERSGVYLENKQVNVFGFEPSYLIKDNKVVRLTVNQKKKTLL
ncbi:MAG: Type 1 glutamine amidotransferase-like domain-containing protein, partial [archaeon]